MSSLYIDILCITNILLYYSTLYYCTLSAYFYTMVDYYIIVTIIHYIKRGVLAFQNEKFCSSFKTVMHIIL